MKKSARGFTLIELLVVISIIAVLSVIGMTIFTGVQSRARDTRRQSEVTAIAKALETNKVSGTTTYKSIVDSWFAGTIVPSDPRGSAIINPQYAILYTTSLGCTVPKPTAWPTTSASDNSLPTAPAITGTGCTGNATGVVVATGIPSGATNFDKVTSFQICALLENGTAPNIFCVPNSQ